MTTRTEVRKPFTAAADALMAQIAGDPLGDFTPSVYETARLIAQAPWLTGHAARLSWLLDQQSAGGLWGGPGGHAVVESLSALDALLTVGEATAESERVTAAAVRSAGALVPLLSRPDLKVPDTVAVDVIVPWLVDSINERLNHCDDHVLADRSLPMPRGFDARMLRRVRDHAARGALAERMWHSLEVTGPYGQGAAGVRPVGGAVCCSPAATAVWAGPAAARPERDFLFRVQARHGGPVPGTAPLDIFERAWVTCALVSVGVTFPWPSGIDSSPLYATRTCAVALARNGLGRSATVGVRSAVRWTLDTQRPDGSWGLWVGSREETAYALQLLIRATPPDELPAIAKQLSRGRRFLARSDSEPRPPQLWHDKGFYTPLAVVRAEEIAAIALTSKMTGTEQPR